MLGGTLLGIKNYPEAEPLLISGYEGMKRVEQSVPAVGKIRLTEALERLVELYTALDKPDEVAKWQTELNQRKAAAENATRGAKAEEPVAGSPPAQVDQRTTTEDGSK